MPDTRTDQHDCADPSCGCKVAAGIGTAATIARRRQRRSSIATACTLDVAGDLPRLEEAQTPRLRKISRGGRLPQSPVFAGRSRGRQAQRSAQTVWKSNCIRRRNHGSCR